MPPRIGNYFHEGDKHRIAATMNAVETLLSLTDYIYGMSAYHVVSGEKGFAKEELEKIYDIARAVRYVLTESAKINLQKDKNDEAKIINDARKRVDEIRKLANTLECPENMDEKAKIYMNSRFGEYCMAIVCRLSEVINIENLEHTEQDANENQMQPSGADRGDKMRAGVERLTVHVHGREVTSTVLGEKTFGEEILKAVDEIGKLTFDFLVSFGAAGPNKAIQPKLAASARNHLEKIDALLQIIHRPEDSERAQRSLEKDLKECRGLILENGYAILKEWEKGISQGSIRIH